MLLRDVSKLLFAMLPVCFIGLAAASCGANGSKFSGPGTSDGGALFATDAEVLITDAGLTTGACSKKTCAELGASCGPQGDGCGGLITSCGTCTAPEFCGGGGPNKCGTMASAGYDAGASDGGPASHCVPATCAGLNADCGWIADGCGGLLLCGEAMDGGPAATLADVTNPATIADAGGASCPAPQYCGGGGPNKCGGNVSVLADGGSTTPTCTPKTCASQGFNCGMATDGCGNALPASCGTCTAPEYCGGGGPNVCGGSTGYGADGGPVSSCVPKSCQQLGYNCGPQGDGCGNLIASCGTCTLPAFCGGAAPGVCGGSVFTGADGGPVNLCVPKYTCASLGLSCGEGDDGCGKVLQCGTCTAPNTCGGGGTAGQCGHVCPGDAGLCSSQAACDASTPTTLTGRVEAGISAFLNGNNPASPLPFPPDPVPNALVYVPNSPIAPFTPGAACRACSADVSGTPLVSTYTNYDGTFTLQGVPSPGGTIPLVIQLGRWRREFTVASPTACTSSQVAPVGGTVGVLNLPRNHNEGDIPLTAVSTGSVDALECVLLKMGVDQAEFTASTGANPGRINIFSGGPGSNGGAPGASVNGARQETALMDDPNGTYMNYDQILFPCWGGPAAKDANELANLITYANNGGHFFATHYSYSWLHNNGEFNEVANWDLGTAANSEDEDNPGAVTWTLNVSTAPPVVSPPLYSGIFYKWLNYVCALSNSTGTCTAANPYNTNPAPANPQVAISSPRFDADSVANGSVDWIDGTDQTATENNKANPAYGKSLVEHFTFNTPVGATSQCGHAIYSDFHVANVQVSSQTQFPAECTAGEFSAQEKVLEYMLFDLASCVSPPTSSCTPKTCADQGLQCGTTGDGCGNTLNCGTCPTGQTCGGGGTPGVCGAPDGGACTPLTCQQQHLQCGPAGDGCGNEIAGGCGNCPSGQTCGGGGTPGVCGAPDGGACVPRTCTQLGITCGPAGDGCGDLIAGGCGTCPAGQTCGGGGVPGKCGTPDGGGQCVPETCLQQNITCGPAGDGCGGLIDGGCGSCATGQMCGAGGMPGQCGGGECVPQTCAQLGYNCGPAGNGCGGLLQCGTCEAPNTCGGGGTPGVCGNQGPR